MKKNIEQIIENNLEELFKLRKKLHANPELAHNEKNTSEIVKDFISKYKPAKIVEGIGGTGLAFVFKGEKSGCRIMFRCELDALPISETNTFDYESKNENISHKCGHDGHMTIVSGLAPLLNTVPPKNGEVVLLFQPAEETGEGAVKIINDKKFKELKPDYIFALHNLPGFEKNSVITKRKNFAAGSKGMIVKLFGKTSHAAEPENGRSPSTAVSQIILNLESVPKIKNQSLKDFSLVTLIHTRLGERAFGTTPGYAEIMFTLRAFENSDMDILTKNAEEIVKQIAAEQKLKPEIEWSEVFPATVNDDHSVDAVKKSIKQNNFKEIIAEKPFKWSEDFGHFTELFNGALFGLGSGTDTPKLHNPDYDFPEEIIATGIKMFYSITENILTN